jgi:hypothetical protein
MQTRSDPRPPRVVSLAALVLLAVLCLGIIATSQTLWAAPPPLGGWDLQGRF